MYYNEIIKMRKEKEDELRNEKFKSDIALFIRDVKFALLYNNSSAMHMKIASNILPLSYDECYKFIPTSRWDGTTGFKTANHIRFEITKINGLDVVISNLDEIDIKNIDIRASLEDFNVTLRLNLDLEEVKKLLCSDDVLFFKLIDYYAANKVSHADLFLEFYSSERHYMRYVDSIKTFIKTETASLLENKIELTKNPFKKVYYKMKLFFTTKRRRF